MKVSARRERDYPFLAYEYVPVTTVLEPAVMTADWQAGVLAKFTDWPKHTWWVPTGRSVNTPQSSDATPSIKIVAGVAGEVTTWMKPR